MWWIGIIVPCGLLALFILFDQRKNIFKKKVKKEKPIVVEPQPKQEVKKERMIDERISFLPSKPQIFQKPIIEETDFEEMEEKEYAQLASSLRNSPSSFRRRRSLERQPYDYLSKIRKPSIKQQIKNLSPEMKAILFANVFSKFNKF